MGDDPFQVYGSVDCFYIVVNQIKEHYLAASNLLPGRLDRPDARFWIFGQVLDACSKCIENAVNRIGHERGIVQGLGEGNREFRRRVCVEAGVGIGARALAHLKTLTDHWNDHKHSGDGEAWKRNANLRMGRFTVDSFRLTTAFVAAYYRSLRTPEEPDWLRQVVVREGEIVLLYVGTAEVDKLMADWEITISRRTP